MTQNNENNYLSMETLEQLFTAIEQRFEQQDQLINKRFDDQDIKIQAVLDIVTAIDQERKETRFTLWDHEKRINALEKRQS